MVGNGQTEKNELEVAGSCENTYVRTTESIRTSTYLTYMYVPWFAWHASHGATDATRTVLLYS